MFVNLEKALGPGIEKVFFFLRKGMCFSVCKNIGRFPGVRIILVGNYVNFVTFERNEK